MELRRRGLKKEIEEKGDGLNEDTYRMRDGRGEGEEEEEVKLCRFSSRRRGKGRGLTIINH